MRKTYSVKWVDDQIASVEIDGERYQSLDHIPDPDDRHSLMLLMRSASDLEISAPTGKASQTPRMIFVLFLAIAVLMLVIFVIATVITSQTLSQEKSATGVVLRLIERQDISGNVFYYPVVEYTLPNGELTRATISEGSYPASYYQGQQVTVRYNPEQPLEVRIQSSSSATGMWTLSIVTGFLGVAFLGAALLVRWFIWPGPGQFERKLLALITIRLS